MLERIISGGQTGADIGALIAAKKLNVPTGGWMPRGWLTELGPKPAYEQMYGLREAAAADYPTRTAANVRDSDGTLIFDANGYHCSRGTILAVNECERIRKPYRIVFLSREGGVLTATQHQPKDIADWIRDRGIKVLNCAGNRESKAPGIAAFVESFVAAVIEELRG